MDGADLVLMAVKPQNVQNLLKPLKASADPESTIVSVIAGTTCLTLSQGTGVRRIVRTM